MPSPESPDEEAGRQRPLSLESVLRGVVYLAAAITGVVVVRALIDGDERDLWSVVVVAVNRIDGHRSW